MNYITTKEAAEQWGLSERRVQVLCRQGKIPGVFRLGWAWAIPKGAAKPEDHRKTKPKENQESPEHKTKL
jgi:excisionase family DNA binding protein